MKNQQRPSPRVPSSGQQLYVHSIFSTIQGEGPHAGRPAVFVRLAGCNLQCPLCDTDYTGGLGLLSLDELVNQVQGNALAHSIPLVVITGGEPFRQNITPFCAALQEGFSSVEQVQIETNGMLRPCDEEALYELCDSGWVDIVISPKTANIHGPLEDFAVAFKYVVRADDVAEDGLPITALDHPVPKGHTVARPGPNYEGVVYVQPADEQDDEKNRRNLQAAVDAVQRYPIHDRRLCLQLHKYAGLE